MPLARGAADARDLASQVTELTAIPKLRASYPVPNEPNMLFYIQRSVNANTVIYAAHVDARGRLDPDSPVDAYWRWYNVDGHRRPLNFIERVMAYGVKSVTRGGPDKPITFKVAALPERTLTLDVDSHVTPRALARMGGHTARLVYVYLQVDDSGLTPSVTALDLFGIDTLTGKALREHLIPR